MLNDTFAGRTIQLPSIYSGIKINSITNINDESGQVEIFARDTHTVKDPFQMWIFFDTIVNNTEEGK